MKRQFAAQCGLLIIGFFAPLVVQAQTVIIPQIADGGGWRTTLVLTNTSASTQPANLTFFQEIGGGATQPWNPPFLETGSSQSLSLSGGATLFLHTAGSSDATIMGWAQLQGNSALVAYAIFTQRVSGRPDQDGTSVAASSATRFLVPFDNTNGLVTAIAIANPNSTSQSVAVGIQTAGGAANQASPLNIPANGHMAFVFPQQFSATNGQSGLAEFYSPNGNISILALRANPTGAFTTAPVYPETGSPIIGGTGGGPSGSFPQFSSLSVTGSSQSPAAQSGFFSVAISLLNINGQPFACRGGTSGPVLYSPTVSWSSYAVNGLTVTCTGLDVIHSLVANLSNGMQAQITSASVTFTLSPQTVSTTGTVSGSVSLTSLL
ncbi:MAG: hypothetical protein ACREIC_26410, partial [Limisphaerales bacterium]